MNLGPLNHYFLLLAWSYFFLPCYLSLVIAFFVPSQSSSYALPLRQLLFKIFLFGRFRRWSFKRLHLFSPIYCKIYKIVKTSYRETQKSMTHSLYCHSNPLIPEYYDWSFGSILHHCKGTSLLHPSFLSISHHHTFFSLKKFYILFFA